MMLSRFLWITPFATFILGYLAISFISSVPTLQAPALIGQSLDKAAVILSQKNLNLRIIGHKDEPDLVEGTIVSQTPSPGSAIKEHQALYLVIARKPMPLQIPDLHHKTAQEATKIIEGQSLHAKIAALPADYQSEHCIAQYPAPGMAASDQGVIIYTAQNQKPVIMPNLKKKSVDEVLSFLQLNGCTADILHATPTQPAHQCNSCIVLDQRPLPGSLLIITPDKSLKVQLQVGA